MKKKMFSLFLALIFLVGASVAVLAIDIGDNGDVVSQEYLSVRTVEVAEYPDFIPRTYVYDRNGNLLDESMIPSYIAEVALCDAVRQEPFSAGAIYYTVHTVVEYPDFIPRAHVYDRNGNLLDESMIPLYIAEVALYIYETALQDILKEHLNGCNMEVLDMQGYTRNPNCLHRRWFTRRISGPTRIENTQTHCYTIRTIYNYVCEEIWCGITFRQAIITDWGPEHSWQNVPNRPGEQVCARCFNIR